MNLEHQVKAGAILIVHARAGKGEKTDDRHRLARGKERKKAGQGFPEKTVDGSANRSSLRPISPLEEPDESNGPFASPKPKNLFLAAES